MEIGAWVREEPLTLQRRLERGLGREKEEAGDGEARSSAASAHADIVARRGAPETAAPDTAGGSPGFRRLFGLRRFCPRMSTLER